MSMELVAKYAPKVDEVFKAESKLSLITNTDYDWSGAHTVKVWKISTSPLNDYARNRFGDSSDTATSISRYGEIKDLSTQVEEMILKNDKSFIFNIDKLDNDETANQLEAETALAREIREVVIPTVDQYTYGVMAEKAGTKASAVALNDDNIYDLITAGTEALDNAEVPPSERVLIVTPAVYRTMKKSKDIVMETSISDEKRTLGVIGNLDGMEVVRVPSVRLPNNFGFMICHPSATTAPTKLEDYGIHPDTVLSSGTIVTGRICYDAYVLENKAKGIYYQPIS